MHRIGLGCVPQCIALRYSLWWLVAGVRQLEPNLGSRQLELSEGRTPCVFLPSSVSRILPCVLMRDGFPIWQVTTCGRWCSYCGHGGHTGCMLQWMRGVDQGCPTGCGCMCREASSQALDSLHSSRRASTHASPALDRRRHPTMAAQDQQLQQATAPPTARSFIKSPVASSPRSGHRRTPSGKMRSLSRAR